MAAQHIGLLDRPDFIKSFHVHINYNDAKKVRKGMFETFNVFPYVDKPLNDKFKLRLSSEMNDTRLISYMCLVEQKLCSII